MPKEDRSDWVAVESDVTAMGGATDGMIRKPQSAYQYFQKDIAPHIREEYGKLALPDYGRAVKEKWDHLSIEQREYYENLHREDVIRYRQESHAADVAALQRKQKLQEERQQLVFDTDGGTKRTTRGRWQRKQRKKMKSTKDRQDGQDGGDDDDVDHGSEASWDSQDPSEDSEDSSSVPKKKKRVSPVKRQASQKQIEYRQKIKQEKHEKDEYIAARQDDLRKERSSQAKRRLEYLLKQGGNIFSHFGRVKEDTAKYGIKKTERLDGEVNRRKTDDADEDHADLEEADEHEATFLQEQPKSIGFGTMRPYQLEGLNWMIRLQENGVNGILADEMGLGKTLQSIAILVYMLEFKNIGGPHLIVVPKSTLSNWMSEFARWAPTLKAIRFHGDKTTREQIVTEQLEPAQRDEDRTWNVCVTTYEVCNIEKNALSKFAWCYLVIDEAHRLKNEASTFSKTVRLFETRYRILLTGTPLQNSLHELWALLNFLVPDVFESAEQFDEWFNLDIEDNDEKNKLISQLHKILRPFMLRRLKADVEKSLPPKHETILFTGMSALQKKLYRDILIRDIDALHGTSGSRMAILNIVMQLRKCAGHPYLFPGVEDRSLPPLGEHLVENCGKMVVLDKLLKRLRERGHRVLLFTQMTRILDILEDYLVMRRYPYCRIDGNTAHEDREEFIDKFNAPESDKFLFLLSTRAGGLGINLQTADVVILFDSDWNPQADLQAQDRAHRIGQKKPVQVFRLVTEHTIEEKIVERAQQKLKLDAMVVQQGRLKDKDKKLSREELLAAVRFGADKIFKSKDSTITDDDIDLILDAGKRKTEELNEKLRAADKGDLFDFKLDGSSVQTFEGVDYSAALAQARADADMLQIFDIGKRERKEAIYNENSLYQRQVAALQGTIKKHKKRELKLPKHLRLPRMEEWQMYNRQALQKLQEEEEETFKNLPEEYQKLALVQPKQEAMNQSDEPQGTPSPVQEIDNDVSLELPPLLSKERQVEKEKLLAEGFSTWKRYDYQTFVKLSAKFGRANSVGKIAIELGKSDQEVKDFADAFWGDTGKQRISEHEYDRVVKLVEKGEKKIKEVKNLERGTRILVSLFDNPWKELEFTHVNAKDKMFTADEDRHLLCWSRKFGYGQWQAVRLAVRRSPLFRFDYFLRSLPVEQIGRRCEQLMRFAEKEVEALERKFRELSGLPVEVDDTSGECTSIKLPKFNILEKQRRESKRAEAAKERKLLEDKVTELEGQIRAAQAELKELTDGRIGVTRLSPEASPPESDKKRNGDAEKDATTREKTEIKGEGAIGPGGTFMPFPDYDGSAPPEEWKKPFTHFCITTRRVIKSKLDPSERKNKKIVNDLLKDKWLALSEDEKGVWREWTEWDKKRYSRDVSIFESRRSEGLTKPPEDDNMTSIHVPKKRQADAAAGDFAILKKKRPL